MLTRFAGASAERIMSRYHHALTMVIEGQLRMPCKATGSTATSMQDIKQLAAYVPALHVRQPATHPQKSLPDPHLTKLLSDVMKCIMNKLVCTCIWTLLLVQYRT